MSSGRKLFKRVASGLASAVLIVGASHGAITTAQRTIADGAVSAIPARLIYEYTGLDTGTGGFDRGKAMTSIGTIVGSIAAAYLIRFAARRM